MSRFFSDIMASIIVPARLVFIMWLMFFIEVISPLEFGFLGILPRTKEGLIGIVTSPVIHGSYLHIISNTFPILILGSTLYFFYDKIASKVFLRCYFLTGILVWLFGGGSTIHIGASGVVYGIAFFLTFFGFFRKDFKSIAISLITLLAYGGLFYGLLPTQPGISYESHLLGALVGIINALALSKIRRTSKDEG
ncbi:rhomboid family intramembrane serine protease [Roseivirga sp. BDSF3-8]|uniref:rhomboid family intramembrane serine protease n=1 Tax=Roseivirga sp. BDSF3-8 TaxID=3241598 RepID=UPI003532250B